MHEVHPCLKTSLRFNAPLNRMIFVKTLSPKRSRECLLQLLPITYIQLFRGDRITGLEISPVVRRKMTGFVRLYSTVGSVQHGFVRIVRCCLMNSDCLLSSHALQLTFNDIRDLMGAIGLKHLSKNYSKIVWPYGDFCLWLAQAAQQFVLLYSNQPACALFSGTMRIRT